MQGKSYAAVTLSIRNLKLMSSVLDNSLLKYFMCLLNVYDQSKTSAGHRSSVDFSTRQQVLYLLLMPFKQLRERRATRLSGFKLDQKESFPVFYRCYIAYAVKILRRRDFVSKKPFTFFIQFTSFLFAGQFYNR